MFPLLQPIPGLKASDRPHGYFYKGRRVPHTVSGVLDRWFRPFDAVRKSEEIFADVDGLRTVPEADWSGEQRRLRSRREKYWGAPSAEAIRARWKAEGKEARTSGKTCHRWIELYYHNKRTLDGVAPCTDPRAFHYDDKRLLGAGLHLLRSGHPLAANLRTFLRWDGRMRSAGWWVAGVETPLYWRDHGGRCDALFRRVRDGAHMLVDFKFGKLTQFPTMETGTGPFAGMYNRKFDKYAAQMNYYAVLLKVNHGVDVEVGGMYNVMFHEGRMRILKAHDLRGSVYRAFDLVSPPS